MYDSIFIYKQANKSLANISMLFNVFEGLIIIIKLNSTYSINSRANHSIVLKWVQNENTAFVLTLSLLSSFMRRIIGISTHELQHNGSLISYLRNCWRFLCYCCTHFFLLGRSETAYKHICHCL